MPFSPMIEALASLAAVLALVLAAGWLARTSSFARPLPKGQSRLRILEVLPLDPRRRLVLVQCDDRCLVLLTGPQDQVVGWLPDAAA